MTATTVDPETNEVLQRQGALQDALRVFLRGAGLAFYRDLTASTRYTWSGAEIGLDDKGRVPVGAPSFACCAVVPVLSLLLLLLQLFQNSIFCLLSR